MTYVGADGLKHRPYMVHRALLGSLERFFGVLTEHYAGAFPAWLAPEQVRVLPVKDEFIAYADTIAAELRAEDLRVEVDRNSETIGSKIRSARNERVPYMLVVGGREAEAGTVAVRSRADGELGAMPLADFKARLTADIRDKK